MHSLWYPDAYSAYSWMSSLCPLIPASQSWLMCSFWRAKIYWLWSGSPMNIIPHFNNCLSRAFTLIIKWLLRLGLTLRTLIWLWYLNRLWINVIIICPISFKVIRGWSLLQYIWHLRVRMWRRWFLVLFLAAEILLFSNSLNYYIIYWIFKILFLVLSLWSKWWKLAPKAMTSNS